MSRILTTICDVCGTTISQAKITAHAYEAGIVNTAAMDVCRKCSGTMTRTVRP